MAEQSIVVRKRRFFDTKAIWILAGCAIIVLLGTVIQMRMTWSRERLRDVGSDTVDAVNAARSGVSSLRPASNPFQPLIDLFHDSSSEPTAQ